MPINPFSLLGLVHLDEQPTDGLSNTTFSTFSIIVILGKIVISTIQCLYLRNFSKQKKLKYWNARLRRMILLLYSKSIPYFVFFFIMNRSLFFRFSNKLCKHNLCFCSYKRSSKNFVFDENTVKNLLNITPFFLLKVQSFRFTQKLSLKASIAFGETLFFYVTEQISPTVSNCSYEVAKRHQFCHK